MKIKPTFRPMVIFEKRFILLLVLVWMAYPIWFVSSCAIKTKNAGVKFQAVGPQKIGRIPESAENITYVEPPPFSAIRFAEFDIDYDGYLKWVGVWRGEYHDLSGVKISALSTYEFVDDVEPLEARAFIKQAIAEWQERH